MAKSREERRLDHDIARTKFFGKRAERDALMAMGDRKGAQRAHRESTQIVRDYRANKH